MDVVFVVRFHYVNAAAIEVAEYMDVLMIKENYDELLSDAPLDWLVQEPKEVTSHWLPTDFGINEELI